MGLAIKKARRDTVSYCILGFGIISILINLSAWFFQWFMNRSADPYSIAFSFGPGFLFGIFFIYVAIRLNNDKSWFSKTYEKLSAGVLLIIAILFCAIVPLVLMGLSNYIFNMI